MTKLHALRIPTGKDLKQEIAAFVEKEGLKGGVIVSAAGGLSAARIRMPGAHHTEDGVKEFEGPFEIVSLMGMPQDGMHLHISVADKQGNVFGGHMKDGCITRMTVELFILNDDTLELSREPDPETGFDEMKVKRLTE